jgi:hypothetical protein
MEKNDDLIDIVKRLAKSGKIAFKRHALIRMVERRIALDDVFSCLCNCELVENYPDDRPLPSCLVLGRCINKSIHAVVAAQASEMLWVITVYQPSAAKWHDDLRTRRDP